MSIILRSLNHHHYRCHRQFSMIMMTKRLNLNRIKDISNNNSDQYRYIHNLNNNNNFDNNHIKLNQSSTSPPPTSSNNDNETPTRATEEQLSLLSQRLIDHLPVFFQQPHDFRLYNRNIIFEDNIRNIHTKGLNAYAWQIIKIKMGAHLKYGKVAFNILKITQHVEDSTIKIRWRITTYPGNKIIFAFWQFKLWNSKESLEQYKDEWIDGFSILNIGSDGLIYRHVCDKVMPNNDEIINKKTKLEAKLGVA